MAEYAKRTCHKCGIRKPQPQMVKKSVPQYSASTNLQRKKSTRVYGRSKEVFLCESCAESEFQSTAWLLSLLFVGFMVFMIVIDG